MMDFETLPKVTELAIPIFVIAIVAEIAAIKYFGRRGAYETNDALTSLLMGVGNVVSGLIFGFIAYNVLIFFYPYRVADVPFTWWAFLVAFVLEDFRYYWEHRISHRMRWGWASHVNHHSSQHYNLTTALRQTWTGVFIGMFVLAIPMVLLGFHPKLIAFVAGLNLVYQFWIHTEAIGRMWKPIELVFNTPSHHRVHHATNPRYLDANYAGTLIIWDRMFGTFVEELDEDMPRYGLVHNIATFNPVRVAFHEWLGMFKDALQPGISSRDRFNYLFKPPGWSHDRSRQTSKDIKAAFVALNPSECGKPGLN
jgi:sterol desaturase/sphingolipid hydroxylase (fatty acid hydroxylase superfamily)